MDSGEHRPQHPAQKIEDTLYECVFIRGDSAYVVNTLTGHYHLYREDHEGHSALNCLLIDGVPYRELHRVSYKRVERAGQAACSTKE